MIKIITYSVLMTISQFTLAQDSRSVNLKFGAHGGGFGFGPAIEVRLGDKMSFGVVYEEVSLSAQGVEASSSGAGVAARYYLKNALTTSPYIQFAAITGHAEAHDYSSSIAADATSISLSFGKAWLWSHFNLDAGFGLRSNSFDEFDSSTDIDTTAIEDLEGTGLSVNFSAGFAF